MGWCAAFGCQNNSRKNKDKSFFLMPENKTTKSAWIKAVKDTVTLKFTFFLKNIFFQKYIVFVIYYKFSKQKI